MDPQAQLQDLLARYIGQLVQGCGSSDCHEPLCNTGQRSGSTRVIRHWKSRSARAIALAIVGGPSPAKHLCQYYRGPATDIILPKNEEPSVDGSPRDPTSFQQLLCDTDIVRKACNPHPTTGLSVPTGLEPHFRAVNELLGPFTAAGGKIVCDQVTAAVLVAALAASTTPLPPGSPSQFMFADEFLCNGSALPTHNQQIPADPKFNTWLGILDFFEPTRSATRLLGSVLQAIALRCELMDQGSISGDYLTSNSTWSRYLSSATQCDAPEDFTNTTGKYVSQKGRIVHRSDESFIMELQLALKELLAGDIPRFTCLVTWLKAVFLTHWNGDAILARDSIAYGALKLISILYEINTVDFIYGASGAQVPAVFFNILAVPRRLLALEVARTWSEHHGMNAQHHTGTDKGKSSGISFKIGSDHLLRFDFLFDVKQRAVYFRALNHLKMRQAHSSSDKASALHRRMSSMHVTIDVNQQVEYNEESFLLINAGRESVLKDAYDQLWQRRADELLRPLRVRLGEADLFELGQDLGGVQIEFFNLVCREVFAEDAGMFTVVENTGQSYFRPASLQPIHMFELTGTLLALAVYNGITLPMSLPTTLYRILLAGQLTNEMKERSTFAKDWPATFNSLLHVMQQYDNEVACAGLDPTLKELVRQISAFRTEYLEPFPMDSEAFRVNDTMFREMCDIESHRYHLVLREKDDSEAVPPGRELSDARKKYVQDRLRVMFEATGKQKVADKAAKSAAAEVVDLDYSFPLEANGLRLSGCYEHVEREAKTALHVLKLHEAVPMHAASAHVELHDLQWPGWTIERSEAEPVTNKHRYCHDYMQWLMWNSVAPQWEAFLKGFYRVVDKHSLSMFSPSQLKEYVEGTTRLDIRELRRVTRYDGYDPNCAYMKTFWRIVSSWTEEDQRALVKFVTAAERIPVGGAREITFVIQRAHGEDLANLSDARLPTSSTCFGVLVLPKYSSGEILNRKLGVAVKYGMEGFGQA
ncbi:hypothetical protein LTR62_003593 [Meristemomyces frigidus]|uniref:HECT-type E3 ubiquitin transferase n=1 Tax=Meristemomyces frigidus TaxID=1508187 RepID=A0AAN7TFE9_9PEZI|nr:hypothetical protein LTR62_003593 [Meristemomyces frigidus]